MKPEGKAVDAAEDFLGIFAGEGVYVGKFGPCGGERDYAGLAGVVDIHNAVAYVVGVLRLNAPNV